MRKSRYNKTRKPTLKYFKKGNTKNGRENIKLYNVHVIVLVFPHSTCIVLITKVLKILIFVHGGHKKKWIRIYSIFSRAISPSIGKITLKNGNSCCNSCRLTSYVPWLVPRLKGQINTNLSQWNFYLGDVITIKSLIFFIFHLF